MDTTRSPTPDPRSPILYPVILAVPEADQDLAARERVENLSRHARKALGISAKKSGVAVERLLKDEHGAPLPFAGNYWSVTHKPAYVGGVIAAVRIGIDIEKIRPCSEALFKKTADEREWRLAEEKSFSAFFRYWTSKECVLKAAGTGMRDLSRCRIVQIDDGNNITVAYRNKRWHVEHAFFDGHIASVIKNGCDVRWVFEL